MTPADPSTRAVGAGISTGRQVVLWSMPIIGFVGASVIVALLGGLGRDGRRVDGVHDDHPYGHSDHGEDHQRTGNAGAEEEGLRSVRRRSGGRRSRCRTQPVVPTGPAGAGTVGCRTFHDVNCPPDQGHSPEFAVGGLRLPGVTVG